jgi:hypothetical protein
MYNIFNVPHNSAISSFASAMSQALCHLDKDGGMTVEDVCILRQAVANIPNELRLNGVIEINTCLEPFESLPVEAQHAILRAIVDDERWRMAGYELCSWHFAIARILQALYLRLLQYRLNRVADFIHILADVARKGPRWMLYAIYRLQLEWKGKFYRRPTLKAVLGISGIKPWNLAVCYARCIPQPVKYRGFWHDSSRHNTIGVVLGIDLIPTPEGCWYVESNLNCALRPERTALYSIDPFVSNLLDFAKKQGYTHLVVMAGNVQRVDKLMAKQYEEGAAARGIKLNIIEDAYLPRLNYMRSFGIPSLYNNATLMVRIKFYHTNLDYLFNHKWISIQSLEIYKRHSSDPALLLPSTSPEPVLGDIALDDPFPNLVYKLPDLDEGKGVAFLKVSSAEHARAILKEVTHPNHRWALSNHYSLTTKRQKGLFQSYIRSQLLPGRRLYIIRAHVLITPIGIKFLSAHRVVSERAVPEYLLPGIVRNPRPYIVNYSVGSKYEVVPPEEELAVETSALAIANGLAWAATYGFQTMTV